jgi:ABC-type phosphate/phosphonate transport system substrate-binding protein
MGNSILLGAVAYDPKVVTIWDGFQKWFADRGFGFDYILYSNYERQVQGHLRGEFDVAWNSPLAWLQTARIADAIGRDAVGFAMRDTDCDLTSVVVVPGDSGVQSVADLRGKRVAVGAPDSPQATLIPLIMLAQAGLRPGRDFEVVEFDVLFGKHGDHIGGERDAARALAAGQVDAACMIDGNHLLFTREGTLPSGSTRILAQTDRYDHCIFTALDDLDRVLLERFRGLLLGQRYDDAEVRPLLDLEGLKQWKPGRTKGFAQLAMAIDELEYGGAATVREFIASTVAEHGR